MKRNFVVSAFWPAWIRDAKNIFAIDPYIVHVLEREGRLSDFENVSCPPPHSMTREEVVHDHEFVDEKYHAYMEIIPSRLDAIHNTSYGDFFWKKSLSIALLRHVTVCYQLYKNCETWMKREDFDFKILDPQSYVTPVDFDEHRRIFLNTDFGQEQLFSVYCRVFLKNESDVFAGEPPAVTRDIPAARPSKWRRLFAGQFVSRLLKAGARKLLEFRNPTVAIINSFFSAGNFDKLLFRSLGRIQNVILPTVEFPEVVLNWTARDKLVEEMPGFDQFDRFVFASLRHAMPKAFIENFHLINERFNSFFDHYPKLHTVVSEAWIGDMFSAMALAILKQRGVKHVFNEHNYIAHAFLGNNLKYLYPLSDKFMTLGWGKDSISNLMRSGSMFQWVESPSKMKDIDLLFVSSIPNVRAPEINSSYGESGAANVATYLQMNKRFFSALSDRTLSKTVFRAYPAHVAKTFLAWDQTYILKEYIDKVRRFDDGTLPSRFLMQRAHLVVVNYLSTAYLEALIADIPTVILFNEAAYLFDSDHADIFDGLFEAGIMYADPKAAAVFIDSIVGSPLTWWRGESVRKARAAFLQANIGRPEKLENYLLRAASVVADVRDK